MSSYVIACDLGTGGNKAALYDAAGICHAEGSVAYATTYPRPGYHEQRPDDWVDAVRRSIRALLAQAAVSRAHIVAIALSGHSLGCVPLDAEGSLLLDATPIWSDRRATAEAARFFAEVSESEWYMKTGNGFPPPLYTVFKAMWLRENLPEVFARTSTILGTKDYVNFRLTGRIATDHSYASGSGLYDLANWRYDPGLLAASGLSSTLFPPPLASTDVLGPLTEAAAAELDLPTTVRVVAGGVDNSCMALGARNTSEGSIYNSLGSSSWLTVTGRRPVLNDRARPFVFAHVIPGLFNSAMSTFSSGTSFDWMRDILAGSDATSAADHAALIDLAATAPVGANRLFFVPTLAGGTVLEGGPETRGGLVGLDLSHTRADVLRATLEGIAFSLRVALDRLRAVAPIANEMIVVGGGSQSQFWRQIYADTYGLDIVKTNVDKGAAALGAAALALVGTGLWPDFSPLAALHIEQSRSRPDPARQRIYEGLLPAYRYAARSMAELGHLISTSGRNT